MIPLYNVRILTPERTVYEADAESLVAPGELGYLGILAEHAPLITSLVPGNITLKDAYGKVRVFSSKGRGFLEVAKNRALLLLDSVEESS